MKSILKALAIIIGIYIVNPFTPGMNVILGFNIFILWQLLSSGFDMLNMFKEATIMKKFKWLTIIIAMLILGFGGLQSIDYLSKPAQCEFITTVNEKYGDRFVFTNTNYKSNLSYVFIECRKCHHLTRVKAGYLLNHGDKVYCIKCKNIKN
jgi:hypothetical protein